MAEAQGLGSFPAVLPRYISSRQDGEVEQLGHEPAPIRDVDAAGGG